MKDTASSCRDACGPGDDAGARPAAPSTFHRRPLPAQLVDFSAPRGRVLLTEALAAGTAEAFFPLVAHLHTQAEPAWCGLGTLVTVLNALQIDPGRAWKGPWRFFGEELLICCKALEVAAAEGLTLAEVGCLAACNGAAVAARFADAETPASFRAALIDSTRAAAGPFLVANYDRAALAQTGAGHFSPLAAWHEASDHALVLDVARFKYPPHWVPVDMLFTAMTTDDDASGRSRGWLSLTRAARPSWPAEAEALATRLAELGAPVCAPPP